MSGSLQKRILSTILRSGPITAQQISRVLDVGVTHVQNGLVAMYIRQVIEKEPYKHATHTLWRISEPDK